MQASPEQRRRRSFECRRRRPALRTCDSHQLPSDALVCAWNLCPHQKPTAVIPKSLEKSPRKTNLGTVNYLVRRKFRNFRARMGKFVDFGDSERRFPEDKGWLFLRACRNTFTRIACAADSSVLKTCSPRGEAGAFKEESPALVYKPRGLHVFNLRSSQRVPRAKESDPGPSR